MGGCETGANEWMGGWGGKSKGKVQKSKRFGRRKGKGNAGKGEGAVGGRWCYVNIEEPVLGLGVLVVGCQRIALKPAQHTVAFAQIDS